MMNLTRKLLLLLAAGTLAVGFSSCEGERGGAIERDVEEGDVIEDDGVLEDEPVGDAPLGDQGVEADEGALGEGPLANEEPVVDADVADEGSVEAEGEPLLEAPLGEAVDPIKVGKAGELLWELYPSVSFYEALQESEADFVLAAIPTSEVLEVKYEEYGLDFLMEIGPERTTADEDALKWLYHGFELQFLEQDWRLLNETRAREQDFGRSRFIQGNNTIELIIDQEDENIYRVHVNFLGVVR